MPLEIFKFYTYKNPQERRCAKQRQEEELLFEKSEKSWTGKYSICLYKLNVALVLKLLPLWPLWRCLQKPKQSLNELPYYRF